MKRPRQRERRGGGSGKDYGRRTPPPEGTGLESAFLATVEQAGQALTILLRTGETVRGTVESFDRDVLTIRPADGPPVVLRKTDIRYLQE